MVYSWDDKEAECYRLYVEEKRSLDEVISYWEIRGFTPRYVNCAEAWTGRRTFLYRGERLLSHKHEFVREMLTMASQQTRFPDSVQGMLLAPSTSASAYTTWRWDFPSKRNPAHKNSALIARLRELWAQNFTQKDMVDTLQSEGFPINDRELIRLRLRLKLLLRESVPRPKRGIGNGGVQKKKAKGKQPKTIPGSGLVNQLTNVILAEESSSDEESEEEDQPQLEELAQEPQLGEPEADPAPLSAEEVLRKQLRQQHLQLESDEKWRARKRRRRTRGWAGLPADAPGEPPRFPSETTIDEAKAYLGLDNNMYRQVRERFLDICKEQDVIKKTIAGPEKWAQIVQQLIREDAHLSAVFQQEAEVMQNSDALFRPKGQRALSLDVICMDVTKRLRTMETRMTLPEAKNYLGLNPEQTRIVRTAFAAKLKVDHFTNKHEAGEQHWTELKQAWVNESEFLMNAFAQGETDPDYMRKLKAVEVLARDVMKRQQQEKTAKDPYKKKQIHQGPGPGPAPPVVLPHPSILQNKRRQSQPISSEDASQTSYTTVPSISASSDLQIDPSLLLAASDAAILPLSSYQPDPQHQHQHRQYDLTPQHHLSHPQDNYPQHHQYYPASLAHSSPLPVYFRLHPHSTTSSPSKTVWLSILQVPSIAELQSLTMREHPGTVVSKLEGVISYRGGQQDVVVEVGDDEELGAYLAHVRGDGQGQGLGKATFVVTLGMGGGVLGGEGYA